MSAWARASPCSPAPPSAAPPRLCVRDRPDARPRHRPARTAAPWRMKSREDEESTVNFRVADGPDARPPPAAVPLDNGTGAASGRPASKRAAAAVDAGPGVMGFMVWGPPGSGKSTLCEVLSQRHSLVHVNIGDLLRAHVLYKTPLGLRARPYVEQRRPVPDNVVVAVFIDRLGQSDCRERGWLLDGFPRSVAQEEALRNAGFLCSHAFVLHAPKYVLEDRTAFRRVDPETQKIYNLKTLHRPCEEILERLVPMGDFREQSVTEMLNDYAQMSAAMLDRLSNLVVSIDAAKSPSQVADSVSRHIEDAGFPRFQLAQEEGKVDSQATASTPTSRRTKVPMTLIRCDGYMCERESVENSSITFRGAATEQVILVWNETPKTVLLLTKQDAELMASVVKAARHLIEEQGVKVVVEPYVQTAALANGLFVDSFTSTENLHEQVDVVVCLGGDGLILHASTLFKTAVPPLISFNLGTLGFLTPFDYNDFNSEIDAVLRGNSLVNLRMRLTCKIIHADGTESGDFQALNEVVVDRGASPYLSNLDCFCDDKYITTVQADGIIMSTPTGSTAYSMSAGGSMVHPSVPAILFTPICPHSLAFRPVVFPDSAKLRVDVSVDSRSNAWASFDGKSRQRLRRGDGLLVEMSRFPVPTVNKTDHTGDWFGSLDRAFNFNTRGAVQRRPPMRRMNASVDNDIK